MPKYNRIVQCALVTVALCAYLTPAHAAVDLRMNHRDCERTALSNQYFGNGHRCKIPNHIFEPGRVSIRIGARLGRHSMTCAVQRTRFGTNELVTLAIKRVYADQLSEPHHNQSGWMELSYDRPFGLDYYTLACNTAGRIITIRYKQD